MERGGQETQSSLTETCRYILKNSLKSILGFFGESQPGCFFQLLSVSLMQGQGPLLLPSCNQHRWVRSNHRSLCAQNRVGEVKVWKRQRERRLSGRKVALRRPIPPLCRRNRIHLNKLNIKYIEAVVFVCCYTRSANRHVCSIYINTTTCTDGHTYVCMLMYQLSWTSEIITLFSQ